MGTILPSLKHSVRILWEKYNPFHATVNSQKIHVDYSVCGLFVHDCFFLHKHRHIRTRLLTLFCALLFVLEGVVSQLVFGGSTEDG